jgi:phage pi2 protein 07
METTQHTGISARDILQTLHEVNLSMSKMVDTFGRLEKNETDIIRELIQLRANLEKDIHSANQGVGEVDSVLHDMIERWNIEFTEIKMMLNNMLTQIPLTMGSTIEKAIQEATRDLGKNCDECQAIKVHESVATRLWWAIGASLLALLTLLGLNVSGIIKLPMGG